AERTAIFKAASTEGPSMKLKHVFVAMADHKEGAPCGACRQVIAEFDESTMVYFKLGGETKTMTVSQLLPCNFDKL
ncbi:MAG: cytidine deaminase, partial [Alphaproteobacteria bacterium]|nr:cytidine deaminase [Alphaproteobacteria bacterium]